MGLDRVGDDVHLIEIEERNDREICKPLILIARVSGVTNSPVINWSASLRTRCGNRLDNLIPILDLLSAFSYIDDEKQEETFAFETTVSSHRRRDHLPV